jgi:hypothetical protein
VMVAVSPASSSASTFEFFFLCSYSLPFLLKDVPGTVDTKQESRSKVAMRYYLLLLISTFGIVADAQKEEKELTSSRKY